jgi:fibronectin-binding autotransporter adhesin
MMSRIGECVVYVALAGTLFVPAIHAQYTADFQTNIISGVTSNWSGDYFVGLNTYADVLMIENGGVLSNGNGQVGYNLESSNNVVIVAGSNASWNITGQLWGGNSGSGNLLVITNGGHVAATAEAVLGGATSSSGNRVIVTGTGSLWTNGPSWTEIGRNGSDNSVTISDGAQMTIGGILYMGDYSGPIPSTNNILIVTGTNSFVSALDFRTYGPSTTFIISNGAHAVAARFTSIAYNLTGPSNMVVVTGAGSRLEVGLSFTNAGTDFINGTIWVGEGHDNRIAVSDGATVRSPSCFFGAYSEGNAALITGTGSLWETTGDFYIGYGDDLSQSNRVTVADDGKLLASKLVVGVNSSGNQILIANASVIVTNFPGGTVDVPPANSISLIDGVLMANVLKIGSDSTVSGCGTITAVVVNNGTLATGCASGTVTIGGSVTNNASIVAGAGQTINFLGPVVNNGIIDAVQGTVNFSSTFTNNGVLLDANSDPDGDGFTNLQEFQAGTDPTNSASAFRILSVVPTNDDMLVSWTAGGGRTNVVQSATDLTGSYANVSTNIVLSGSGDVTTNYLDAGAATNAANRFYRIALVP